MLRGPAQFMVLTLVVAAFAGCIADATPATNANGESVLAGHFAGPALWPDPQNAPHPAWNWATLSNPTAGPTFPLGWRPIPAAPLPESVTGMEHVKRSPGNIKGAGIAAFGSLVVVPGFGSDSHVVDLSNPSSPVVLSTIPENGGSHRGAAVIAYPSGWIVAVFATSSTLEFWDITNPAAPRFADVVSPVGGSHKVGVVPGTPVVYNANTDGAGSSIGIYDARDPYNVVLVQNFNGGYGCHHIYFWVSDAKQRGICAGVQVTQLLDIADPFSPEIVVNVPVHHGIAGTPSTAVSPARFSHFAILSEDGNTLIVGDETGGGIAPGCDVHAQALGLSASGPLGNVYFYDVSEETQPELLGWFNPGSHFLIRPTAIGACTAHHGRLVPDPAGERDLLAMAYYSGGVVLIDFTDPANAQLVDQWATGTTWEVWYDNGYLITGDLSRGLDVLRLV